MKGAMKRWDLCQCYILSAREWEKAGVGGPYSQRHSLENETDERVRASFEFVFPSILEWDNWGLFGELDTKLKDRPVRMEKE